LNERWPRLGLRSLEVGGMGNFLLRASNSKSVIE